MNSPFFSVVIPTYNRAKYLPKAVDSILNQRFTDFEVIVVDDGSEDNTSQLMKEFSSKDERLIYIHQVNKGRSTARNVGIEKAKGEYICFLDSDDYWKPEHLESYHQAISKAENPSFFYCGLTWWFDAENKEQRVEYKSRNHYSSDVEFVIANEFAPDCVSIHHSILAKHQFNPSLFINEDLELWARVAAENPVIEVDANTAVLRVHPGNTITSASDSVTPRIKVFNLQLSTKSVMAKLSEQFITERQKSLHELLVRHLSNSDHRWKFIQQSMRFVVKYPSQRGNSAKLVSILYALPGGAILKRLIQGSKASN